MPNDSNGEQLNIQGEPHLHESSSRISTSKAPQFIAESQGQQQHGNRHLGDPFIGAPIPALSQTQIQDFTWLESLPADLLAGEYEDFSEMFESI